RLVSGGGIVGVILRTSDYHRLRKPESAMATTPPAGGKPKVKMSTSWGAKPYQEVAAAASPIAAPPPPAGTETASPAAAMPADLAELGAPESAKPKPADANSMVAERAKNVLDGLRG